MDKKVIVLNDYISQTPIKKEDVKRLQKFNIDYIGKDCENDSDFLKYAKNVDILFDQGHVRITKKVIDNLSNLKAILRSGIGVDNVDIDSATKKGVIVSNTPGFCADEVSTHAIALLLSFVRKIPESHIWVRQGKWNKLGEYSNLEFESIFGENIGIIGFGNIGKNIYKKLYGFDSNVFVYDPYVEKTENIKYVKLNELLKKSKYIIIACPLVKKTVNMIDEEQFKIMRSDAVIINIARGKIINENVLIKYLKEKKISGACLDVFYEEPINSNNPLMKLENVIMSPHSASVSYKSINLALKMSFDEIIRIVTGKPPMCRVN